MSDLTFVFSITDNNERITHCYFGSVISSVTYLQVVSEIIQGLNVFANDQMSV